MDNIIVEFSQKTTDAKQGVTTNHIQTLQADLESQQIAVEVKGLPYNPPNAIQLASFVAAWYGVKVIAKFLIDHDDTWNAVTTFIGDVMDGHLNDGWVKIEVASDGTVTQTTHKGSEHPEGSIVTVKDGKEEVREPDSAQFTRDHFVKALREVLKALLS